jgi:hypothetical protein
VLSSHAKEYRAFARECLEMAEKASCADLRLKLIELSRQWMRAAIAEEVAQNDPRTSHHVAPRQQNKLASGPAFAAPDEHDQLVKADQRFQAALDKAIATGRERVEAVQATVHLKRRTKLFL